MAPTKAKLGRLEALNGAKTAQICPANLPIGYRVIFGQNYVFTIFGSNIGHFGGAVQEEAGPAACSTCPPPSTGRCGALRVRLGHFEEVEITKSGGLHWGITIGAL